MDNINKKLYGAIPRDLFVLDDENNLSTSKMYHILASTTLDRVFDDQDPDQKTLREIIEDLKQEIITGGKGNVIFPVTSVNGKTDDVNLTKVDLGLGRVDNTSDINKPLSEPQREAINTLLKNYDFQLNLQEFYDHIMDTSSNPHNVTFEQMNMDGTLSDYVKNQINAHNISTNYMTHIDIRRSLMQLWSRVDDIDNTIDDRLNRVLDGMDSHYIDALAHQDLFDKKENLINKVNSFSKEENISQVKYPSTRAVVEFFNNQIDEYDKTLNHISDWIANIHIVDSRSDIPVASSKMHRQFYFIRKGEASYNEVAICRKDSAGRYYWEYNHIGSYSKFNKDQFIDNENGLSLNISTIVDYILDEHGALDTSLSKVLENYYKKDEIENFHFIDNIVIVPGTTNGTIRFYINGDTMTMTDDIPVAGLKRLAYLDHVTEDEIWYNAIYSRHIVSNAIETRHIIDQAVLPRKIQCSYGSIIGNNRYENDAYAHEIKIIDLANMLVPLIAGLPDPSSPDNPYFTTINNMMLHPHKYEPRKVYNLGDYSYACRFTGTISCDANRPLKRVLTEDINSKEYRIIDAGGSWEYQSSPSEWTILAGSNITGHTYGTLVLTETGLNFESVSIGDRMEAKYDIWIKFIELAESSEYENM